MNCWVICISCNSNPNSEVRVTTLDYSVLKTFLNDSLPSTLVFDKKNIFIANKKNNITDEIVRIIDEKLK